MGNGESKEEPKSPSTPSPLPPDGRKAATARQRSPHQVRSNHHARAGSAGLGFLASSITSTTPTTSTAHVHATNPASSSPSRSRPRSVTSAHPPHPSSLDHLLDAAMGNADSKPGRPPSRANTIHVTTSSPPPSRQHEESPEEGQPRSLPSEPAPAPVDIPTASRDGMSEKMDELPIGYSESPYGLPPANYIRPPRLPLPIEEEVHNPGSPILSPQDIQDNTTILDSSDIDAGVLPRKTSTLSSTTVDDDDIGDNEAFAPDRSQWGEIRVPTRLEWNGSGDKIFVTGTFCNWEKKVKLHKNKDKHGFSANVNLRPGTHHVKFLVDGEMVTSNELPTTVDWTNILVNYIEIVAPMPAAAEDKTQPPAPSAPMPIPGAALTAGQAAGTDEPGARPSTDGADTRATETDADLPSTLDEATGKGLPVGTESNDATAKSTPVEPSLPQSQAQPQPKATSAPPKQKIPRPRYTNEIPEFLVDLDNYANPEDEKFQRAQRVAGHLPSPPSLPMFLSKSILNGTTPHKDDASVLIMPNHTVLNHLATSSIKSGVLATSGTTRYKRKFLTTIMYKPTSDEGHLR